MSSTYHTKTTSSPDMSQWVQQFLTDMLVTADLSLMQRAALQKLISNPSDTSVLVLDPSQMQRMMGVYVGMTDSPIAHGLVKETPASVYVGLHIKDVMLDVAKIFATTTPETASARRIQWLNTIHQVQSIITPSPKTPPTLSSAQSAQQMRVILKDWARFCIEGPTLDLDQVEECAHNLAQTMANQWISVANPSLSKWSSQDLSRLRRMVELVMPDAAQHTLSAHHLINIYPRLLDALIPIMRQALLADGLASLDVRVLHIDRSITQMHQDLSTAVKNTQEPWSSFWKQSTPHPDDDVVVKACVEHALKLSRHPSATLLEVFATFRAPKPKI